MTQPKNSTRRRWKGWLGFVALVFALFVAWFWLRPTGDEPIALHQPAAEIETAERSSAPIVDGVDTSPAETNARVALEKNDTTSVESTEHFELVVTATNWKHGDFSRGEGHVDYAARYAWKPETGLHGSLSDEGTWRVDFDKLARSGPFAARHASEGFVLTVDVAGADVVQRKIALADFKPVGDSTTRRATVEVNLQSAWTVSGRLLLPNLEPAFRAEVALLFPSDGPTPYGEIASTNVDEQGQFRIRAAKTRRVLFVGLCAGNAPLSMVVEQARGLSDLGDLVFDRGESVDGHVGDTSPDGVRKTVRLQARSEPAETEVFVHAKTGWSLIFSAAYVDVARAFGTVMPDGGFSVSGLGRRAYALDYHWADRSSCEPGARTDERIVVVAPATGVQLTHSFGRVMFVVKSAGKAVEGATVSSLLDGGANLACRSSWTGEVDQLFPPGMTVNVQIEHERYRTQSVVVTAPGRGQFIVQAIELVPRLTGALDLSIVDERLGKPIETAVIRVELLASDSVTEHFPEFTSTATEGVHRLDTLPAGRLRLGVSATGVWDRFEGYSCPTSIEVDVIQDQRGRASIRLEECGRIRVSAAGLNPNEVGRLEVHDDAGTSVAFEAIGGSGSAFVFGVGALFSTGSVLIDPPLRPGSYSVSLHLVTRETMSESVLVEAGKTSSLEFRIP